MAISEGEKMVHLLDIHSKINKNAVKINKLWKKIESSSGDLIWSESVIYAIYLQIIRNCPTSARRVIEEYTKFLARVKEKRVEIQFNYNKNAFFKGTSLFISMEKEDLGTITAIAGETTQLGYLEDQLKGKNIDLLVPDYFKLAHRTELSRLTTPSQERILFQHLMIFIQHKDESICPVNIYIAPIPFLAEKFSYLALIKPIASSEEYLIIDDMGTICSCTAKLKTLLGITSFRETREQISSFCLNKTFLLFTQEPLHQKHSQTPRIFILSKQLMMVH